MNSTFYVDFMLQSTKITFSYSANQHDVTLFMQIYDGRADVVSLFFKSINHLENALNVSTLRQRTIASNIANVDTPNYKSKQVSFQSHLTNEIHKTNHLSSKKTHENHIAFSSETDRNNMVNIKVNRATAFQNNGNNVDIDYEMSQLAKNQLQYHAIIENLSHKLTDIKTVVKGGR
jgi:flagellar basal-body rod protein FlgB